jgi:hypothetical protein
MRGVRGLSMGLLRAGVACTEGDLSPSSRESREGLCTSGTHATTCSAASLPSGSVKTVAKVRGFFSSLT